jgi:hypothetical protein
MNYSGFQAPSQYIWHDESLIDVLSILPPEDDPVVVSKHVVDWNNTRQY